MKTEIFKLEGEITEENVQSKFRDIYDKDFTNLIIDCTDLTYICGGGLGYIMDLDSNIVEKNGKIVIYGVTGGPKDIMELTGITTIIHTIKTREEAEDFINK